MHHENEHKGQPRSKDFWHIYVDGSKQDDMVGSGLSVFAGGHLVAARTMGSTWDLGSLYFSLRCSLQSVLPNGLSKITGFWVTRTLQYILIVRQLLNP